MPKFNVGDLVRLCNEPSAYAQRYLEKGKIYTVSADPSGRSDVISIKGINVFYDNEFIKAKTSYTYKELMSKL